MINKTFIIGITGNIATGKSVIRRMLANAGVMTIDADVLANRMIYPGGPAYQSVIAAFGPEIKTENGRISHQQLGQIVFNDPEKLKQLEALIHPPVIRAILGRVRTAGRPVVAIEAIKLLESDLSGYCDSIWVSHATYKSQMQRLMHTRGLSEQEARTRIEAQSQQVTKLSQADVIINTEATFKDTWVRTQMALNDTIQPPDREPPTHINSSKDGLLTPISRIATEKVESAWFDLAQADIPALYEHLGMQAVLPMLNQDRIEAFLIWRDWNFTAMLEEAYPVSFLNNQTELAFDSFERTARVNQVEILLIAEELISHTELQPTQFGYIQQHIDQVTYPAWQQAAEKTAPGQGPSPWMKVLAQPFEFEMEPTTVIQ